MNTKAINTGITVISFLIGLVGLILGISIMSGNDSLIDAGLRLMTWSLIAAAAIALLFGIVQFLTHIKGNMSLLIGIVAFGILIFIGYSVTQGERIAMEDNVITAAASHWSATGLVVLYILLITATVTAILGEVIRLFK